MLPMSVGWQNFVVCIFRVSVLLAAAHPSSFDVMLGTKGPMLSIMLCWSWLVHCHILQTSSGWSAMLVVLSHWPNEWSEMGETEDMLDRHWPGSRIPWEFWAGVCDAQQCDKCQQWRSIFQTLQTLLSFMLFGDSIFHMFKKKTILNSLLFSS